MRTTIDGAGRLVIPKSLRDELGLGLGIELEVEAVDGRLQIAVPSRVRVEEGPFGPRFAVDSDESLSSEDVRRILERTPSVTADTSVVVPALPAGVGGGASYDGLVALQAAAHHQVLLTVDVRAKETYRRLDVPFELIAS